MSNKTIKVSNLVYEMLVHAAKKNKNKKPDVFLEELIEDAYRKIK